MLFIDWLLYVETIYSMSLATAVYTINHILYLSFPPAQCYAQRLPQDGALVLCMIPHFHLQKGVDICSSDSQIATSNRVFLADI